MTISTHPAPGAPARHIAFIAFIAFIADGNRRWAAARGMSRASGFRHGALAVRQALGHCRELSLEAISVFLMPSRNFHRAATEVTARSTSSPSCCTMSRTSPPGPSASRTPAPSAATPPRGSWRRSSTPKPPRSSGTAWRSASASATTGTTRSGKPPTRQRPARSTTRWSSCRSSGT
ncbi:undecaprenyl diphosphate synthase family protein [Streptomyces blattellae]|uniref:undecaprenyl diphosphate synthase family protein n=1 Tax=Streptomyces blattellae TaxID=2569855 RepID=UPI0012B9353F